MIRTFTCHLSNKNMVNKDTASTMGLIHRSRYRTERFHALSKLKKSRADSSLQIEILLAQPVFASPRPVRFWFPAKQTFLHIPGTLTVFSSLAALVAAEIVHQFVLAVATQCDTGAFAFDNATTFLTIAFGRRLSFAHCCDCFTPCFQPCRDQGRTDNSLQYKTRDLSCTSNSTQVRHTCQN